MWSLNVDLDSLLTMLSGLEAAVLVLVAVAFVLFWRMQSRIVRRLEEMQQTQKLILQIVYRMRNRSGHLVKPDASGAVADISAQETPPTAQAPIEAPEKRPAVEAVAAEGEKPKEPVEGVSFLYNYNRLLVDRHDPGAKSFVEATENHRVTIGDSGLVPDDQGSLRIFLLRENVWAAVPDYKLGYNPYSLKGQSKYCYTVQNPSERGESIEILKLCSCRKNADFSWVVLEKGELTIH